MRAWYAFYPKDFMIDTMHLSLEEDCMYRRLIDLYYMEAGPIENNPAIIAKKLRVNPKVFRRLFPSLQNYFQIKNGFLHHKRIDMELQKSKDIQERRAEAGRKGGKANAKQLLDDDGSKCLSMPQPLTTTIKQDSSISSSSSSDTSLQEKPKPVENPYKDVTAMPYKAQEVIDLYHEICTENPKVLHSTWKLEYDMLQVHRTPTIGCSNLKQWTNFFKRVKKSDWLTGKVKVKAYSLRKLLEMETYTKIAEGQYDNRQ